MKFEIKSQLKTGVSQQFSPKMIRAMEILELSYVELEKRIIEEVEKNVLLEKIDSQDLEKKIEFKNQKNEKFDGDAKNFKHTNSSNIMYDALENISAKEAPLTEQLLNQWKFADVDPESMDIGCKIIEHLDPDGFLRLPLEEISKIDPLLTIECLEKNLRLLQRFLEPSGIAARSIRESFLIQVERKIDNSDLDEWERVYYLIENHYEDIIENRLLKIVDCSDYDLDSIEIAIEKMKTLSVYPANKIQDHKLPSPYPEVIAEFNEEVERWVVYPAKKTFYLEISERYKLMLKDSGQDDKVREFLGKNLEEAKWLIDAIGQRQAMLLKVAECIVNNQSEFINEGDIKLKPLTMSQVASDLGVHVATVSRAVSGKFIQVPRGSLSLRGFFTNSLSGSDITGETARSYLQDLIKSESKSNPLTDDQIVEKLSEKGVNIARRTVVKYRQKMGILSARLRKKHQN